MIRNWVKKVVPFILLFSLLLNPFAAAPVHALSAPNLVAPADGMTTTIVTNPPLAIPEFKWAVVTGAATYRLQVSNNIGFSGTLAVNEVTPNTTYTPKLSSSFPDGIWYWRVRVETPAPVSAYSEIWSFTKQWATPENSPPLITPDNDGILDFYDQPVFSWGPVTGAASYKLQIYTSPGGYAAAGTTNITTLATTHQPKDKLANGTYYWRVVPLDPAGHLGTASEERSFTASYNFMPMLLEPADGATPTFTPTMRWTAVRGAQFYLLQYGTDPSFATYEEQIDTRNTTYTPTAALPNDVNYYWRVRVHSGASISSWTSSRTFIKRWYIKPVLLTPVNLYQHVRFPILSWTPVPGAATYKVEISKFVNFLPLYTSGETANTFYSPIKYDGTAATYYWRVRPVDGNGNLGQYSNTSSYVSYAGSLAPHQVYPLYYYTPDTYAGFPGVTTTPHEDRTVAEPIFIWHRVYIGALDAGAGQVFASAYRLQVSTDATFTTVNWSVDTENTVATPTAANSFTPLTNTDYYWRVRPLISGNEAGEWSQIWKTRFDPVLALAPNDLNSSPALIRPASGFEFAETTPLLEWFPLTGASSYDVQISSNEAFSVIVDSKTVNYPAYAPSQSLAQRNLGDTDFGVYYWRVRQSPNGAWSEARRFQVAAQSQWKYSRTLGDTANRLQIGSDPASDATIDYDLTTLQVSQSSSNWFFGFNVPASPAQNVTYALYLDLDHISLTGASIDARGFNVSTIPAFRPEYAIYVLQEGGVYTSSKVYVYRWNGSGWDTVDVLSNIGGQIAKNGNYVELAIPNTAIGYQDTTGSYAVSLFSLPAAGGQPQDSVPSDPAIPGAGPISRFSNVTERMNLLMPPNNPGGVDPTTYPSILPFFWDWPILSPWAGAVMVSSVDPLFTSVGDTYSLVADPYYATTLHSWLDDFNGDNSYYWRIQPRYEDGSCNPCFGAWSQGERFERQGFIPQNLQTSVTFATPTFSWEKVEGASSYDLEVDNDPAFGSKAISVSTKQNSYTDDGTLGNAIYYWRVRARRDGSIINDWSTVQSFTLELPAPTGLNQIPSGVVGRAPTLCWDSLIKNSPLGEPVLAAYKYRVQVSKDDIAFSTIYETVDTEQRCWTPIKGYDDATYYWRVAMIDGQSKLGNYSSYATFTKQYPISTLISPASGATLGGTPTFIWTPVNGAAKYKLEVSQYPNFSPTYETQTTENVRWTPQKTYTGLMTYYWRVAIVDDDGKVGPWVNATIILTEFIPINIYIGASTSPVGSYNLALGSSMKQSYLGLSDGPVKVTSPTNKLFFTSERASSGGNSFNEVMGYPANQFTTEYWFPWYDNIDMDTWLLVGNPSATTSAMVDIYIGGVKRGGTNTIPPGGRITPRFALKTGPVRVVSTNGVKIFTSERSLYGPNNAFNEVMGYPANQFTTEYWFPWYDNASMMTWILVGNPSTTSAAAVDIYIGGIKRNSYVIPKGGQITPRFNINPAAGPVRVVSTNGVKIFSSERTIYGDGFNEVMGYPGNQLTTDYWFPWYDNVNMATWVLVGNPTASNATVEIYVGGVKKTSVTISPGQQINYRYPGLNTGPVRVRTTNGVKVFTSERVLYGSSFNEVMGYPGNKLTYEYWFPWYDSSSMNTDIVVGNP